MYYGEGLKINSMQKILNSVFLRKLTEHDSKKTSLISVLNVMTEREVDQLAQELADLVEFKLNNSGRFIMNKGVDPKNLLQDFWQVSSDACPLEASKAEEQENKFHDYVMEVSEELM